jgi:UDP-N-acetylglucosamine/UDP-N-acetyl-alpha-D-glucosaminouronate 4-epimerase
MKVLVTGGAGFIGSHVADRFLAAGREVRVLDNFSSGRRENLDGAAREAEVVEGDVRDADAARAAAAGCDAVVHLAALVSVPASIADPLASHEINARGTLNMLLAARAVGARRFVFASSAAVYGPGAEPPNREDAAPAPISPYGADKLAGEAYCSAMWGAFGLETVVLRYFNVFGPRQDPASEYAAVIPRFVEAFHAGRSPTIYGDGEQSRDFVFVDDVARANLLALEAPVAGLVANVARGEAVTVNRLVDELRDITGRDLEPVHEDPRPGDIRHSTAAVAAAERELGFRPECSLADGLRSMLETPVPRRGE